MNTLMMAACAAGGCPKHAVAALAGALVVGFLVGRFSARGKCACNGKRQNRPAAASKPRRDGNGGGETRAPIPAGYVEIYVGNLSYEMTNDQLEAEFAKFGKVESARVVTNRFNDKSKGFGFVVMPNRAEAEAAIAALSEKEVLGRKMRVNEAKNTVVKED